MRRRTTWRRTLILAFAGAWLPAQGLADTFAECAGRAYAQDVAGKQEWHRSLRDLIVKEKPNLAALATLDMEHQLAVVDRRQAQFGYLVRTDVRRIRTREGLATFRNFDWTDTDAVVLRQQSPGYVAMERQVVDLERRTKEHQDGATLREYVRAALGADSQFQGLLKRFQEHESTIGHLLEKCQPR